MRETSDSPFPPDWAVQHARAAMNVGLAVPEIEQRLIAKGLTPTEAAAVVTGVLEERLQIGTPPHETDQGRTVARIVSLAAALVCLLLAYAFGGGPSAARSLLGVLPALACIWFPEWAALSADPDWTAAARGVGWLLLLLLAGYRIMLLLLWQ